MEAKICCAYNATRGCKINSTVTVADSAREPLKVLKVLVEGLARDSKSSLWLTPLEYSPQLTRLFPFDFAYLDKEMKVLDAMSLRPETPAPRFHAGVASALILPFNSLKASGTEPGDRIVVCPEEELETRLTETSQPAIKEPVSTTVPESISLKTESPAAETRVPFKPLQKVAQHPLSSLHMSAATTAAPIPAGAGFTVGMTSWRIATSTTTSAAVLDQGETQKNSRKEITSAPEATSPTEAKVSEPDQDTQDEESAVEPAESFAAEKGAAQGEKSADEVVRDTAVPSPAVEAESGTAETPAEIVFEVASAEEARHAEQAADLLVGTQSAMHGEETPRASAEVPKSDKPAEPVVAAAMESELGAPRRRKTGDSASAKATKPAVADPFVTKKKDKEDKKKESLGVLVKRFLNCEDPPPERRAIIRLLVQGLTAYTGEGETRKPHEVRDVSPTGLYLRSNDQWRPNEVISMTLQRKGATEAQFDKHVRVTIRVVRCDEGGAGFSWVWPEGVQFEPWKRVHTKRSDETDVDYFLRELRLTRALAFLQLICPDVFEETKLALHKRLSNKRVGSAVEIALKAQELYGRVVPGGKAQAHPDMVRRVLENGSWTEDDWIRLWWAGLLVSSCSTEAPDTSNTVFVDLLAKLMSVHLHMLELACLKSTEQAQGSHSGTADVYCTSEELIESVGSQSLARIHQTMGQLSSLGLLAESNKPSYVAVTDKVKTKVTPTPLGLKMYARCNGHR